MPLPPPPTPSDAQSQGHAHPAPLLARPSTPTPPPLADVFGSDLNSSSADTPPPPRSPSRFASNTPRAPKRRRAGRSGTPVGVRGEGVDGKRMKGMKRVYGLLDEQQLVFLLGARDLEVQTYREAVGGEGGREGVYGGMSKEKLMHLLVARDVEREALRDAVRGERKRSGESRRSGKMSDQVEGEGNG